mgnify:CR=1 FL=1
MKRMIPLLLSLLLVGCGGNSADGTYQQITQEEAKEMMDNQEVIILDVREQDEYDSGHIPGAVLLPQREPQQDRFLRTGRPGLHRPLRIRRH